MKHIIPIAFLSRQQKKNENIEVLMCEELM